MEKSPKEEKQQENPECPDTELTRDDKGMLFYKLEDFEKLFKYHIPSDFS